MLYLTQIYRTASCCAKFSNSTLLVHERVGSSGIACWRALPSLAEGRPPIEYTHWCCVPQTLYRMCMHTPFNIFLILCRNFTQTFPECAKERDFENEIFEIEVQLSKDKRASLRGEEPKKLQTYPQAQKRVIVCVCGLLWRLDRTSKSLRKLNICNLWSWLRCSVFLTYCLFAHFFFSTLTLLLIRFTKCQLCGYSLLQWLWRIDADSWLFKIATSVLAFIAVLDSGALVGGLLLRVVAEEAAGEREDISFRGTWRSCLEGL